MSYFVTGGTGFIGRHLIERLLQRRGTIYVLVRRDSKKKLDKLRKRLGANSKRIVGVTGDLTRNRLGVSGKKIADLKGKVRHVFHLAALYDLAAGGAEDEVMNIDGTRHAVRFAEAVGAGCFHHISSIAAAGTYKGTFREDMFEEAEGLDHPYFRTKHESERLVREECPIKWRVYRPGIVVGHSQTGEMDKIDGPYYFFKLIQKMRRMLPPWMPTVGLEGGRMNLVPVDFVAGAIDHIAHSRGLDGKVFHLTDPEPLRVGEVLNLFARAGHAPEMSMRIDARMFQFIPNYVRKGLAALPPVKRFTNMLLNDLGIPADVLAFINYPTRFDSRETEKALKGSGIEVPRLESYAWRLWDYWERHLDPELYAVKTLEARVSGRVVMVTGASSGIGKAAALKIAAAGAKVLLVARSEDKLVETREQIEKEGGEAHIYSCDIADFNECEKLVSQVLKEHQHLDILVNNAGRSIRRSIALSYDRFHDFERTMQLNYFGALKLILGFLPSMQQRRRGHVINISSIGVLSNAPRFSAYVASKAALDAFSRCAASEFSDENVNFTSINMPLVRTPMIAPTKIYDHVPTITPEDAADMIADAIIRRPQRIATRLGVFAQVLHAIAPKMAEVIMNAAFKLFPDSAAAKGMKGRDEHQATSEQIAFASLMRGIHW